MTKNEISRAINKHSILPLITTLLIFMAYKAFDIDLFGGTGIGSYLTVFYTLAMATYILKNVLCDLFAINTSQNKTNNDS